MAQNNSFITADNDYIEDVTALFNGRCNNSKISKLLDKLEGKSFEEYTPKDVKDLIDNLKLADTETNSLSTQVNAINKDLAQMRRLNAELSLMITAIKEACKKDQASCDRLTSIVRAFKLDTMNTLFSFTLDNEDINVTCNQMKQIVGWYPKGYVYFKEFDDFNISTDKVHLFTFGEVVSYIDRRDESKNCECLVVGEDENTVHVMFLSDFDRNMTEEGVMKPTFVLKSRIHKREGNKKKNIAVTKRVLMTFLLNIGYTNPFHDETQY